MPDYLISYTNIKKRLLMTLAVFFDGQDCLD